MARFGIPGGNGTNDLQRQTLVGARGREQPLNAPWSDTARPLHVARPLTPPPARLMRLPTRFSLPGTFRRSSAWYQMAWSVTTLPISVPDRRLPRLGGATRILDAGCGTRREHRLPGHLNPGQEFLDRHLGASLDVGPTTLDAPACGCDAILRIEHAACWYMRGRPPSTEQCSRVVVLQHCASGATVALAGLAASQVVAAPFSLYAEGGSWVDPRIPADARDWCW